MQLPEDLKNFRHRSRELMPSWIIGALAGIVLAMIVLRDIWLYVALRLACS